MKLSMVLTFQAAADRIDITPDAPLPLAGFGHRTAAFDGIDDRLEANALLLDDGSTRVALVSADLLFIGEELRSRILDALTVPLEPECLLLAASHTHHAPMTLRGMPKLGIVDDHYVGSVARKIVALIDSLAGRLTQATLRFSQGNANHSINRRLKRLRIWWNGVSRKAEMGPNRRGGRDETLRVLRIDATDGACIGLAWNYACHPTGYPYQTRVTAEFPGVVRRRLRASLGDDLPVLFFQGFSGDIRSPFLAKVRGPVSLARRICLGPTFGLPSAAQWGEWAESLAGCVLKVASSTPQPFAPGDLRAACVDIPLSAFVEGGSRDRTLTLRCLSIGDSFRLVALAAEPVHSYRRLIEACFPGCRLFTAGCIDQVIGYLPSDAMVTEGGYEVDRFRNAFSFEGRYTNEIEKYIRESIENMNIIPHKGVGLVVTDSSPVPSQARHKVSPPEAGPSSPCSTRKSSGPGFP